MSQSQGYKAILTADMQEFSARLKGDEETLITVVIRAYYRFSSEMAQRFSGDLFRREGDAIWCSFVEPFNAVSAGVWLLEEVYRHNFLRAASEQIQLRIGIHWGPVSNDEQGRYGQTLTVAKELETHGRHGSLHLSAEMWQEFQRAVQRGPLAESEPNNDSGSSSGNFRGLSALVDLQTAPSPNYGAGAVLVGLSARRVEQIASSEQERRQARWVILIEGPQQQALETTKKLASYNRSSYFCLQPVGALSTSNDPGSPGYLRTMILHSGKRKPSLSQIPLPAACSLIVGHGPLEEQASNDSLHREYSGRIIDVCQRVLDLLHYTHTRGSFAVELSASGQNWSEYRSWGHIDGVQIYRTAATMGGDSEAVSSRVPYYRFGVRCDGHFGFVLLDGRGYAAPSSELILSPDSPQNILEVLKNWAFSGQEPGEATVIEASPADFTLESLQRLQSSPAQDSNRRSPLTLLSVEEFQSLLVTDGLIKTCRQWLLEGRLKVVLAFDGPLEAIDSERAGQWLKTLACTVFYFQGTLQPPLPLTGDFVGIDSQVGGFAGLHLEDFEPREHTRILWIFSDHIVPERLRQLRDVKNRLSEQLGPASKSRELNIKSLAELASFCQKLAHTTAAYRTGVFSKRDRVRPPVAPYKPLQYFGPDDHSIFFGREEEVSKICSAIQLQERGYSRTSLVYGRAGVGKTSLLRAGLSFHFGAPRHLTVVLRVTSEPVGLLTTHLRKTLQVKAELGLTSLLNLACQRVPGRVLIILDNFEEFFLRLTRKQQTQSLELLQDVRAHVDPRCYWVIGIREDFLPEVTEIQPYWPDLLRDRHRILGLGAEQAKLALTAAGRQFGFEWEPELLSFLISELAEEGERGVDPHQLQMVAQALTSSANPAANVQRAGDTRTLKFSDLAELGGVPGIYGRFLQSVLQKSLGPQMGLAQQILGCLISPEGQMLARSRQYLVHELDLSSDTVRSTIASLLDLRVLGTRQEGSHFVYQLTSRHYIPCVCSWIDKDNLGLRFARSSLKSEVAAAHRLGTLIPKDRLILLQDQADLLRPNGLEINEIVRSCALQLVDPQAWMRNETGQQLGLEVLLRLLDGAGDVDVDEAQMRREIIVWVLRDFQELNSAALGAVLKAAELAANPHTFRLLQSLGVSPHILQQLVGAVRRRFFGPSKMAHVQAGRCWVGSSAEIKALRKSKLREDLHPRIDSEMDYQQLHLDDFFMDKRLVTNQEFAEFEPSHQHRYPDHEANFPVVNINFYQAQKYANWLGKSLPSEVQWEKAARGTDGRLFPWGNEFEGQRVNSAESDRRVLTAVDAFPEGSSPYGCLNMAGNVWEWTTTPWSAEDGDSLVAKKGGCAINYEPLIHCSSRFEEPPETSMRWAGFRCCARKGVE